MTDDPLQKFSLPSFKDGYNSYSLTRSQIKDTEVSGGQNTRADDNGAMAKRKGKVFASPLMQTGYPISALGQLKKVSGLTKLLASGTGIYSFTDTTSTLLTGNTFTPAPAEQCSFTSAVGRCYFNNGIDAPYYTSDGATLVAQAGSFPAKYVRFYNQRLYCVRPQYPDRVYFSNSVDPLPTSSATEPQPYTYGNFGTYTVNLSLTPIQNAGFLMFLPDSGVVITDLHTKGNSLFVYTLEHGIWQIDSIDTLNTNGTVSHRVQQLIKSGGCPAPLSVFTSDNDQFFYGSDNVYSLGEVALYQALRTTPKSGRVQSDMRSVPSASLSKVVSVQFKNADYIFYTNGAYNDRCLVLDKVLNAWSTPYVGWNVSCGQVYYETDGRIRFLAGSSNPADPRVYELEIGTDDNGTPIDANFRDKLSNCGVSGRVKRFAFSNIFYSSIIGSLNFSAYIDGTLVASGIVSAKGSNVSAHGVGSQQVGLSQVGRDAVGGITSPVLTLSDSYFVIDLNYTAGEKMEIVYQNGNTGEQYRILGRDNYFILGDPNERLI